MPGRPSASRQVSSSSGQRSGGPPGARAEAWAFVLALISTGLWIGYQLGARGIVAVVAVGGFQTATTLCAGWLCVYVYLSTF